MATQILSKNCNDHILAHLYEHIYYIQLDSILRRLGFFPIIDYSFDACTTNGKIVFDIELYSDIDIARCIKGADTYFLDEEVFLDIALSQIEVEVQHEMLYEGKKILRQEILQLHKNVNWNRDTTWTVGKNNVVKLGDSIAVDVLRITFNYKDVQKLLYPLYRQIAGVTLNTMISDMADTFGGFVDTETYATDKYKNLIGELKLQGKIEQSEVDRIFIETKNELEESGAYDRLLDSLRNISRLKNPPSVEHTLRDTGVEMNIQKWHEVATSANLKKALNALNYSVKYI